MNYSLPIAYLLWFLGGFGMLGVHRFYLRRYPTAFLWLFTGGVFLIGAIYDFFNLPRLVEESNLGLRYREAMFGTRGGRPETAERVILRLARQKGGVVTPGEVALEGGIPIEEAKADLERLVARGYAELEVRPSGAIAYLLPDFRPEAAKEPPSP